MASAAGISCKSARSAPGLTLADVMRLKAAQDPAALKRTSNKAAIMIYLPGGPSHMDMYDLKPDAPKEFRGEFHPIATNVPGVQICEHFPLQARMWDKLACIRSLVSVEEHSDSLVSTGYSENTNNTAHHPCFGSVVSKLRGDGTNDVPPFVSLRGGGSAGTEPGYLGVGHRPFAPSGPGVENLRLANGINLNRMDDRKGLLGQFDTVRRDIDASGTMKGMDSFAGRAFDMIASGTVRKAIDLKNEDPQDPRPLQGHRAVPHGAAAGRSRRRVRHPQLRRLGHAQQQLQGTETNAAGR